MRKCSYFSLLDMSIEIDHCRKELNTDFNVVEKWLSSDMTLVQTIKSSILTSTSNMNLNALWEGQHQWEAAWQFLSGCGIPRWGFSCFSQKQMAHMDNCRQQSMREAGPPEVVPWLYIHNVYQQILNDSRWGRLAMTFQTEVSLRSNSSPLFILAKKEKELQVCATKLI